MSTSDQPPLSSTETPSHLPQPSAQTAETSVETSEAATNPTPGPDSPPAAPNAFGQVFEVAGDDVQSEFTDEAFSDIASTTASLTSSIYDYRYQHGRRFNAYKPDTYFMPNDDKEQQRMDLQYSAISMVFDEKLHFAPLKDPKRIIDCGTGTGIWPIDMGDAYPDAEKIIGIDLSPIQVTWTPPNVLFQIDDIEETWTFPPDYFDFVHARLLLTGCCKDFQRFYEQSFHHLKPGGYLETLEFDTAVRSDDYEFAEDDSAVEWCRLMREAISQMDGRTLALDPDSMKREMEEAGFVDVQIVFRKTPIGDWPADPKLRRAGLYQLAAMLSGLDSISIFAFTKVLGWSLDEFEVMMAKCRNAFNNRAAHMWWPR